MFSNSQASRSTRGFAKHTYRARQRRIEIIRARLLRKSHPRLQAALMILLTGLAGFLSSFVLLQLGVTRMAIRYPLAIGVAYFIFLVFLALWLWLQRRKLEIDTTLPDIVSEIPGGHTDAFSFGHGGHYGGGGAGGNWGEGVSGSIQADGSDSVAGAIGSGFDLDELWLILVAIVAVAAGLVATFYIIYIAPSLLAEILLDGAVLAGLYRRVKRVEQRHWLRAAVRRTVLPVLLVALFLSIAGYSLQHAVPEAYTLGEVWNHVIKG